jgi:hypothetical protein
VGFEFGELNAEVPEILWPQRWVDDEEMLD